MFTVFTTMNNGELRSYNVPSRLGSQAGLAAAVIDAARKMDLENYPDNPSSFENVSIIHGGSQVYDIVWGEVMA